MEQISQSPPVPPPLPLSAAAYRRGCLEWHKVQRKKKKKATKTAAD